MKTIKYHLRNYIKHETKKNVLVRFLLVLIIFFAYLMFVIYKYGAGNGIMVALLTWSFFVFCTPISDAGLLLDFPVRLILKFRMIYTEVFVWITAFFLNLFTSIFNPSIYKKTLLLQLFKYIIQHPIPFYSIILISAIGTFLSIYFGDELIDITQHKDRKKYFKHKTKYELIVFLFLFLIVFFFYRALLKHFNLHFF